MNFLKIGYCREDFSPDRPVRMNSTKTADHVDEPLCVTALSLYDGEHRVLIIGMDLRNTYKSFTSQVLPMIVEATGVSEEAVIFTSTHNHNSPEAMAYSDEAIRDWGDRIAFPAILRAAKAAVAEEKEVVSMTGGKAVTENLNFVRRYLREDGTWAGILSILHPTLAGGGPNAAPIVAHESEADPELRAVRICRKDGKDVILINYQVHAAGALRYYPNAINADFVGPLRDELEKDGDALVLYLQGACGNINYSTRIQAEKHLAKQHYWEVGQTLAETTRQALATGQAMQWGKLQLRTEMLPCGVNHLLDHLAPIAKEIDAETDPEKQEVMMKEAGIMGRIDRKTIILRSSLPEIQPMELASVSFGDLGMAFAPLEMFDVNGKQLRYASPFPMTFSCGYSLNTHGYLPSHEMFAHGEYEARVCRFIPGTGEQVALALCAQLQDMKKV